MNKTIGVMAIVATLSLAAIAIGIMMSTQQSANAVCSSDGRCSNPDGSRIGSGGASISPCVGGFRTETSSDGRAQVQAC